MADSVKLTIDVEKLKENGTKNYIATEELIDSEQRLQGLIKNDISFSAIVYGYRGTGKSSFVDHALKPFEDDRIIIRFNATKYDNDYNKFLKRFIRELYLAVNKNEKNRAVGLGERIGKRKDKVVAGLISKIIADKKPKDKLWKRIGKFFTEKLPHFFMVGVPEFFKGIPGFFTVSIPGFVKGKLREHLYEKNQYKSGVLKNIYRHTFFNITESNKLEVERKRSIAGESSFTGGATIEHAVDLATIVGVVVAVANNRIIPLLHLPNQMADPLKLLIVGAAAFVANWAVKVTIKLVASLVVSISASKTRTRTKETLEESLYDDEIAEYHVFSELKKISEENKKVIFVLDELDKLDNKTIQQVIGGLKALILSEDVISILVAGKNYEEYWDGEKDETDGIATNLFSQKIYVPLADTMRSKDIVKSLFVKEDQDKLDDTLYVKKLIMESEGVIRELINLVTSDIKWEDEAESKEVDATVTITNPVAETASERRIKDCYSGLTRVEEYVKERYREGYYTKADEMYKLAYRITRYIREKDEELAGKDKREAVSKGLEEYVGKYAKHLTDSEVKSVFDKMFEEEKKAVGKKSGSSKKAGGRKAASKEKAAGEEISKDDVSEDVAGKETSSGKKTDDAESADGKLILVGEPINILGNGTVGDAHIGGEVVPGGKPAGGKKVSDGLENVAGIAVQGISAGIVAPGESVTVPYESEEDADNSAEHDSKGSLVFVQEPDELINAGNDVVYKRFKDDLSDSAVTNLQETFSDIFQLVIHFAQYMGENVQTIMSMYCKWVSTQGKASFIDWPSYEEFKNAAIEKTVSVDEFVLRVAYGNVVLSYSLLALEFRMLSKDNYGESYRHYVAELLLTIYLWKVLGNSDGQYLMKNATNGVRNNVAHGTVKSDWDIEANDNGVLRVVEVKYYKKGEVDPDALADILSAMKKKVKPQGYQAGIAVIAAFVPKPVVIDPSRSYLNRQVDNKELNAVINYIPCDKYENFEIGMRSLESNYLFSGTAVSDSKSE